MHSRTAYRIIGNMICAQAIRESVMSTASLRVDRKAGIIRGVKVLGLVSENGRRYMPGAVKAAAKLYENVRVNVDHPEKDAEQPRSAYDRLGKLVNIRYVEGEGLYGDLEILMTHPMAKRICEAAERMPDAFGLSHNAQGEGEEDKGGVFVVSKIVEVRHVDLVADPATTQSLSESKEIKMSRKKGVKEAMGKHLNFADYERQVSQMSDAQIAGALQDILDTLKHADAMDRANNTDDGGYYRDQASVLRKEQQARKSGKKRQRESIEGETKELSMNDQLKEALDSMREAMNKMEGCIKEAYESDDSDDTEKDAMEAEFADDQTEAEDEKKADAEEAEYSDSEKNEADTEESDDSDEDDAKKGAMESKRSKLARLAHENRELRARERVRELCESAGLTPDKTLLSDLANLPRDAARRTVQRLASAGKSTKPRSTGYAIPESKAPNGIPAGEALFNWLAN